jgi:hypothetical protein
MAGDKIPTLQSLDRPQNVQDMVRRDQYEDCLSCKIVGSAAFFGLAGYSYFSGTAQLEKQRAVILKSGSRFGMGASVRRDMMCRASQWL